VTIYLDQESYSERPIRDGTYVYCASAETDIITYAFGAGPVHCWDVTAGGKMPGDLAYALLDDDDEIVAHNAMFDRNLLRLGSLKLDIPIERWRCTMVGAYAHSLPGALGKLCEVLAVDQDKAKQKDGRALMMLFCKPQPKNSALRRATRLTHPAKWARYLEYAKHDISAMREVDKKTPAWNSRGAELALWHLDQRINDRGFCVDVELARAAVRATDRAKADLKSRTQEMTGYDAAGAGVESTTQRDALLAYLLLEHGVMLPDLQKATLERRLQDNDLPPELRELIAIRLGATTTSTSKYAALLRSSSDDGRLRGTKQFAGAGRTARWAGRVFQPDNLPRPRHAPEQIEGFIHAAKIDAEDFYTDDVMGHAASAVRGCIIAPPGKKLVIGDLANIEGRITAWLAGEEWKLQAYRDYDTILGVDANGEPIRKGPDLYKVTYGNSFGVPPESVTKDQRQIGKVEDLLLGFAGGVGAFVTGAATYSIDLDAMARDVRGSIPTEVWEEATSFLAWMVKQGRPTFGLADDVFIACDSIKRVTRAAQPMITSYWAELEAAVTEAILRPGNTVVARRVKVRVDGAWLRIQLPSGRYLCYPAPRVKGGVISYRGVNIYSKQWGRIETFGGKVLENLAQACARDVLAYGMAPAEAAGYEIVLHVHDELVCETPDEKAYSVDRLVEIMATSPPWADGLPLAAAGFESYRYKKE